MGEEQLIGLLGEFGLIQQLFAPLQEPAQGGTILGIGDDGAVLSVPRTQHLVTTTDMLVEGVHFTSTMTAEALARKALRVNLSDLAAMGAVPRWYLLSIALPPTTPLTWAQNFTHALAEEGKRFNLSLVGGDTVQSAPTGGIILSLTLMGLVGQDRAISRKGAQAGDRLFISGTVGDAALGWALQSGRLTTQEAMDRHLLEQRHILPEPRLELGVLLQDTALAHAAIDISDGLVADLGHLCTASGLAAVVELERLPFSPAARRLWDHYGEEVLPLLLTGGEDYELLFAIPPGAADQIPGLALKSGTSLTEIGEFSPGSGVTIRQNGHPISLPKGGWSHF